MAKSFIRTPAVGRFVLLYLPFPQTFNEMPEHDFIALPIASAADVRVRANRDRM
jgi:hypothetical protein